MGLNNPQQWEKQISVHPSTLWASAHPSASDTPPSSSPVQLPIAASLRLGCSETNFGSEKFPHANLRDLSAHPGRMALLGSKFHPLIMIHHLGYTTEDYINIIILYIIYSSKHDHYIYIYIIYIYITIIIIIPAYYYNRQYWQYLLQSQIIMTMYSNNM